ncbi:MAG: glycoside hydrolase family 15 protein [Candidatus Paceibacterota bacterium]
MARNLILGNNSMLVSFDAHGQVRDLYFPHIGLENHIASDSLHRVGVFVDGSISWFTDEDWNIEHTCHDEALVGKVRAENKRIKVVVTFTDAVYNEKNIFIRNITIENQADTEREIKLYFCHEFNLAESLRADTAYFDPRSRTIIHYKGRRTVIINAFTTEGQFSEYTVGEFRTHNKDGSYKNAEAGKLAQNTIEHGNVDSAIALSFTLGGGTSGNGYYWLCIAEQIHEVHALNQYVLEKNPAYLTNTTRNYWTAWVNRYNFSFYELSPEVVSLFKKSLLFVRAAVDNGGSILASADASMLHAGKDTYSYMWPRDGAICAIALDRAGDSQAAKGFFQFCVDVVSKEGYLMHKFLPDKSLGSSWHPWVRNSEVTLPIQEDETALTLIALLNHYQHSRDLDFIEKIYNSFIKKAADFMCLYRNNATGLPLESYDLWEEKYGVHTFTAATVYGALQSASKFSEILGKEISRVRYTKTAEEIKTAILEHLYDKDKKYFVKMVTLGDDTKGVQGFDDTIDASSVSGIIKYGVLPIDDERVVSALRETENALRTKTKVSGIMRYENDVYYRRDDETGGNPWIITTLWMTQALIMSAKNEDGLVKVREDLNWVASHALETGVLPEQLHPHTGEPLSATPLTWSHAEFVLTVIQYLDKLEEFGICDACNPVRG